MISGARLPANVGNTGVPALLTIGRFVALAEVFDFTIGSEAIGGAPGTGGDTAPEAADFMTGRARPNGSLDALFWAALDVMTGSEHPFGMPGYATETSEGITVPLKASKDRSRLTLLNEQIGYFLAIRKRRVATTIAVNDDRFV